MEAVHHLRAKEVGEFVKGTLGEHADGSVRIRDCLQQPGGVSCIGFKSINTKFPGKCGGSKWLVQEAESSGDFNLGGYRLVVDGGGGDRVLGDGCFDGSNDGVTIFSADA